MTVLPPRIAEMIDEAIAKQLADNKRTPAPTSPTIQEVSDGLHKQIKAIRQEAAQAAEAAQARQEELLTQVRQLTDQLTQRVLALDLKLTEYQDKDRYTITRAHVLKAMREAPDE